VKKNTHPGLHLQRTVPIPRKKPAASQERRLPRPGSFLIRGFPSMSASTFTPSPLLRLLGESASVEAGGMDFAERLALWLNAFDAIRLQSVHQALGPVATQAPRQAQSLARQAEALGQDLQRVRGALAHAIAHDPVELARLAPALLPRRGARDAPAQPEPAEASYKPYRERHLELQRQMDMMIAPLREHVRQALARASTRLRQLAVLDATLEEVMARREQAVLPAAPALLEPRFRQLRQSEDPAWRQVFEQHWRDTLLAEVDLRLQPVTGLVEALRNESNRQP
jgi:hypothetical protein